MADRHLIDVHVLLLRRGEVLLIQRRDRANPQFDGRWHLPSGKVDAGESVLAAAVREAAEEVGVRIEPADLRLVHTVHVHGSGPEPRFGLFFATDTWSGRPDNREPHKCAGLRWFALDAIPPDTIEYPAAGIRAFRDGSGFSAIGWNTNDPAMAGA